MSAVTLQRILNGGPLSENMIGRIRSALVSEIAANVKKSIYLGDWRHATSQKVSAAIADVSEKLIYLKKVIESSNFLHSEDSPVDKIQVLQLIAVLTATIEALRAPLINKTETAGVVRWLGRFAKRSAEKGMEKLFVDALTDAANAGTDLIHHLSSQVGTTDLGNIIT